MSTKEMLLHEIDAMNEKQLQGLLLFIQGCYAEIPNEETRSVLDDLKQGKNMVAPFSSVKELMEDLDAED